MQTSTSVLFMTLMAPLSPPSAHYNGLPFQTDTSRITRSIATLEKVIVKSRFSFVLVTGRCPVTLKKTRELNQEWEQCSTNSATSPRFTTLGTSYIAARKPMGEEKVEGWHEKSLNTQFETPTTIDTRRWMYIPSISKAYATPATGTAHRTHAWCWDP